MYIERKFINADDVSVLEEDQGSIVENNLFAYCLNNPVCNKDSDGRCTVTVAVGGGILIIFIPLVYYWSKKTINNLKSLFRSFPKLRIKKAIVKSTHKNIPTRLIDKKTGNIDLSKFKDRINGKKAYKEKRLEYRERYSKTWWA